MQQLRIAFKTVIRDNNLDKKRVANMSPNSKSPLWEDATTNQARRALLEWLGCPSDDQLIEIAPGQHFLLKMCIKLAKHNRDQDVHILGTLENPWVRTGCLPDNPILDSCVWPLRDSSETLIPSQEEQEPFLWCEGNWQGAEVDEEVTIRLIKEEIEQGWVRVFDGTLQDA